MTQPRPASSINPFLQKILREQSMTLQTAWIARAAVLPGKTLHVALAIWLATNGQHERTIYPLKRYCTKFGIARDALYPALDKLEQAGLIRTNRHRGRAARITLLCEEQAP
jgi:DNA-binding MarR family transcriptional regulator